jgi:DNA (cytosine-5)-methyltransferase 1
MANDPALPMSSREGSLTYLDFFAGAGLVRLGLEPDWSCKWANDIDPRKQEIYLANFGDDEFVLDDVGKVTATSLPAGTDMAWASFPCQDLSLAGWRRGITAERSGTFWEFWRLMRDLLEKDERPRLIVVENVVGMLYGENPARLFEALTELDMQCGALVVDACRFLPQSRPRVFVVAVDARVDCSKFLTDGDSPWFTKVVKKAHAVIPKSRKSLWRWWDLPEPNETVPCAYGMIEADPTNVEWHDQDETRHLLDMMTDLHRSKVKEAARLGKPVGFLYKRIRKGVQRAEVRFDGVAGCLRTPHGGSSRQTVLVVNGSDLASRLLSPREAARLMGVPDSFWLPPRYNDAYRAIGDGVAVPVVSWLSSRLLTPLAQLCRKSDVGAQPASPVTRTEP